MKRTEHTQKWIDALRSGEYEQCHGMMWAAGKVCAVGLGRKIANKAKIATRSRDVAIMLGASLDEIDSIIAMNDVQKMTFPEIADAIEGMIDE